MNELQTKYEQLDQDGRRLLQIAAFQHDVNYARLAHIATAFALRQSNGRALTQKFVKETFDKWTRSGLLSGRSTRPADELLERLVRDGLESENADRLLAFTKPSSSWMRRAPLLDFYVAFFRHDAPQWKVARRNVPDGSVSLLNPFCKVTFDGLPSELKGGFFDFVIPAWIVGGCGDLSALVAMREWMDDETELPAGSLARLLEWAVASGDQALLTRISTQTGGKMDDVEGCRALLQGDFDNAFSLLSKTLSNRANKRALTKLGGLPSLLATLAALAGDASVSREEAFKATGTALKPDATPYADAFEIVQQGLLFLGSPGDPAKLAAAVNASARVPLAKWVAGYLQAWLAGEPDNNASVSGLTDAGTAFRTGGCFWLAAETLAAAGRSNLKTADKQRQLAEKLHEEHRTASLIDFAKPQPAWARTLTAIAALGGQAKAPSTASPNDSEPTDRLIFELIHTDHRFQLDVFHQLRKGSKWSKGRKVALSRLFHQHNEPEFSFLTPQDRALCRTLRHWTERGSYGYPEEYTEFETRSGARALIGHPGIYRPGNRDQPLEIVEKLVSLVVRRHDDSQIELVLEPKVDINHDLRFEKAGPDQVAITFFDPSHQSLQPMLGNGLRVPKSASAKVLQTVTQLALLVTIHSEIGDLEETATQGPKKDLKATSDSVNGDTDTPGMVPAKKVKGDPRLHLHLLPSGDGLRAEFYVQPLGESGPACRPGEGGVTLFATIDGQATSANRDLLAETQNAQALIDRCDGLASHLSESWTATFPTPIEALELLLNLESLSDPDAVILHWPKGRSLRLAGQATESMMRVQIRRDHNWFAASGELKIDAQHSIDMMQLIELASASPGRFIKLDDGRFLALTKNLRQRIDDLRMFGDGRSAKGKLRFAAVHAGLLEDLGEVKVTADTHWKKCLRRMRESTEVDVQVPDTFQAELRGYQQEGIAWMQRLAAWGVGGCLADDMGLGKTIQAIGVLLQRSADGPAIVVAPTSVIHNWHDEITRFAPTLNPQILAESSRKELFGSLTARDVLLCSYGLMQNEISKLEKIEFNTLVLDEAQAIKNAATQRSRAAKKLSANCRFLLTGTPMENHLGELWNLMDFLNPGLLGGAESFQQRFATPIQRDGDRSARNGLKRLVAPFILRRTKAQVLAELPARIETTLRVQPSDQEAAFYEAVRLRAVEKLAEAADGKPKPLQILGEIMRMRRACCHPKLVLPKSTIEGSKLSQVIDTINELRQGNHRALVFSQFVDHLQLVREQLDEHKISYQYLDGGTPAKTRKKSVDAFQSGEGDVFLISLKAGGTGLNLTAADYVIHLDPWWNPAVEDQASDRAHRIGQQRPVTIYRMILAGTIEEKILELHATKRDLAESLLEGTDRSGKLTTDELLRLIGLGTT